MFTVGQLGATQRAVRAIADPSEACASMSSYPVIMRTGGPFGLILVETVSFEGTSVSQRSHAECGDSEQ